MTPRKASPLKGPVILIPVLCMALVLVFTFPVLAARIIDENYEGVGYEETWTETIDSGCILDEDAAVPGTPPPDAGSECLKAVVANATNNLAYAIQAKADPNISYIRGYLYLDEEGLSANQYFVTLALYNYQPAVVARVLVGEIGGAYKLRFEYYSNGALRTSWPDVTISMDTWYRVEYKYDLTYSDWEFRVDGATISSGSLQAPTLTPRTLVTGILNSTASLTTTLYTDLVVWDTSEWPGEEPTGPTTHYVDRDNSSPAAPYETKATAARVLQDAIDWCESHAGAGTVYVRKASTNYYSITMKDNIDVIGTDENWDASANWDPSDDNTEDDYDYSDCPTIQPLSDPCVKLQGSNATFRGFKVAGSTWGAVRMRTMNSDDYIINASIKNCQIYGAVSGINIGGHTAGTIEGCDITGMLGGIVTSTFSMYPTGSPLNIQYNRIHDVDFGGIRLDGDPNDNGNLQISVRNNEIYNNDYMGIRLYDLGYGCDITVDGNSIYNNGWDNPHRPDYESGGGISVNDVSSVRIMRNDIYDNRMAGVCVEGNSTVIVGADLAASDPYPYGNEIYRNYAGVNAGCSIQAAVNGTLIVRGNYIHNNGGGSEGAGIHLGVPVLSTTISQNDIAQNQLGGISIARAHPTTDIKLVITKNDIRDNMFRGGIHTGDRSGGFANPGKFTADSTIKQNKVHHHRNAYHGGGIDIRHFKGTVNNNLVYRNNRGGIRFGDYVTEIKNNTVVGNGEGDRGAGIVYDDLAGAVNAPPGGGPSNLFPIKNNISVFNQRAGIRACFYTTDLYRDYNLLYSNSQDFLSDLCGPCASPDCSTGDRRDIKMCMGAQLGRGCDGAAAFCCTAPGATGPLPGETLILADPLFQDMANDDYHLQVGSPAIGAGELGVDMGAYGGPDAIDDNDFPSTSYVDCLIDGDTTTGNAPPGGTDLYFDLGGTYTVRHVRLYGSAATYTWNVSVADTSEGCSGTQVLAGWSVGGADQWYEGDVTDTQGRYVGITSILSIDESSIFEFQFSTEASPGPGDWMTPVSIVAGCSNIGGLCN